MSRDTCCFQVRWLSTIGLLACASVSVHAAPLRSYTFTDLGQILGTGLDNDGNVIDQPVRAIVDTPPTFGEHGDPRLPGRVYQYPEVIDGTPDGRYMVVTGGAGAYPVRAIMQTFVVDSHYPFTPDHWGSLRLQNDYWTSIRGEDINAAGEVIGRLGRVDENGTVTTYWDPKFFYAAAGETTVHELSELLPPELGWRNMNLMSINDNGQILGSGVKPDGEWSKFILTPNAVPEPGTWAVFGLAAAAAGWRMRKRSR